MNGTSRPAFAVADLTGWQPIDTAPKDGTRILVWNGFAGAYTTSFKDDEWPLGWWDGFGRWFPVPSYWMPLPKPPVMP